MKNNDFGEQLTRAMKEKGVSQTLLAKFCRTTQQTVSRWCKGICEPDYYNLCIICAVLDETPTSLIGYREENAGYAVRLMLQDIVGRSKEFQKAQYKLNQELDKKGANLGEMQEADDELLEEYIRHFCKEYGFNF